MVTPEFCQEMARYNVWQNNQLKGSLDVLSAADLTHDRGAFFGSILGTLNHLLWGDALWMSRFDGGESYGGGIPHSTELTGSVSAWAAERDRLDRRIQTWAATVPADDLAGDLTWVSSMSEAKMTRPMAVCVTHFFNHQTHHRGQIHAMLTAAGASAPVSDLVFMPGDI